MRLKHSYENHPHPLFFTFLYLLFLWSWKLCAVLVSIFTLWMQPLQNCLWYISFFFFLWKSKWLFCTWKRLKPIILIQTESILCIEFPFQETEEKFVLEECHFDLSVLLSIWRHNRLQAVLLQNEFVLKLDLGAKWDFVQTT